MRINSMLGSLVLAGALLCIPAASRALPRVGLVVTVRVAPPVLPVYAQPLCPGPGYIWEPGYWAYGDEGYYWVPGTWVLPPRAGLLWTPGYWGFSDGFYVWHVGYWGPAVGFYGGVNYGFGYPGRGFYGAYWRGGQYFYNTRVTNVNRVVIHNVYSTRFVNERSANRISFNGGARGIQARPTTAELSAARERRIAMTSAQIHHQQDARSNRTSLASANHGRSNVTAVARTAALSNHRESPNKSANNRAANAERPAARNLRPSARPERSPLHKTTHATKPAPARSEKPSEPRPAPMHSRTPAPSDPANAPAHHPAASAPKPAATHTQKSAVHQQTPRPAPAPHPVKNEQSHANSNKPQHLDHQ
jgi:hypothetical protein